jgi:hypothetical protein
MASSPVPPASSTAVSTARHKIPRIAIPPEWPRFLGMDFGGVNTAGIFFAQERDAYHKPTGRLFAYREYRAGDRSATEHCYHLMSRARGFPRHHEKEPGRAEEEKAAEGGLNGGRRSRKRD